MSRTRLQESWQLWAWASTWAKPTPCAGLLVAVVSHMATHGQQPGPFFRRQLSKPLTKPHFVNKVKKALTVAALDQSSNQSEFSGHSFRIRAATAAAQAGIFDSAIQTLGRWSSAAFLSYIRTSHEKLASSTSSVMQ